MLRKQSFFETFSDKLFPMKNTITRIILLIPFMTSLATAATFQELSIESSYTLPISEISGMTWRKNPNTHKRELVVVGDRDYQVYIVDWENRKTSLNIKTIDLSHTKTKGDGKQSEWESVFSDDSGRVYILKESPSQILVLNPQLSKVENIIQLPSQLKEINSGPEGLTLLNNGHLLVVNEKNPLEIIEYGPKSSTALGYKVDFSVERSGSFPNPKSETFPLSRWNLDSHSFKNMEDSSGINTDKNGNLYLLSDQKQSIGLLGSELNPKQKTLGIKKFWKLPKVLKQPEGMVIDDNNQPIIAIDRKKINKTNLFHLSKMK